MFGLMEITASLDESTKLAIIPTFVLPFTILGMILTSVATWVAALFGIKLHTEGPRRLFEVLMKPKVLLLAVLSNIVCYGLYVGGNHLKNHSYPLWWVSYQNSKAVASTKSYADFNLFEGVVPATEKGVITGFKTVWEQDLKDVVFGNPAVSGGSVFVSGAKGRVTELNEADGRILRHLEIGQPVTAAPLIWQGKLFVGEGIHLTHHARLYSFDLQSGKLAGSYETLGHIERSAAKVMVAARTMLIFPAGSDGVYAVDAGTLQKVWQAPIGHVDATPISDGEIVYVGTGQEEGLEDSEMKAVALNAKTGQVLWEQNLPTSSWGIPVLWKNEVCFAVGDVYKRTQFGQISCYDRKSGAQQFAMNTSGALLSQPQVTGDHLLISDFNGVVYQFNLREKKMEWSLSVPTKDFNYASVVVDANDHLIMPGKEGLYVYSRSDQKLLAQWKPEGSWKGAYANVFLSSEGLWIFADVTGKVRALRPQYAN